MRGEQTTLHEAHPARTDGWDETHHHSKVMGDVVVGPDPLGSREPVGREDKKRLRRARAAPQSAIPAGTAARWFLTWVRLTGGPERARKRRDKLAWAGRPPGWGGRGGTWGTLVDGTAGWVTSTRSDGATETCVPGRCGVGRLEEARAAQRACAEERGEVVPSKAHTAQQQMTSPARRLFAVANANTHSRGDRVRRAIGRAGAEAWQRPLKSPRRATDTGDPRHTYDYTIQAAQREQEASARRAARVEEEEFERDAEVERELMTEAYAECAMCTEEAATAGLGAVGGDAMAEAEEEEGGAADRGSGTGTEGQEDTGGGARGEAAAARHEEEEDDEGGRRGNRAGTRQGTGRAREAARARAVAAASRAEEVREAAPRREERQESRRAEREGRAARIAQLASQQTARVTLTGRPTGGSGCGATAGMALGAAP